MVKRLRIAKQKQDVFEQPVLAESKPAPESLKIPPPEATRPPSHDSAITVTNAIEVSTRRICQAIDKVALAIQMLLPPLTSVEWHVSHMHAKIDTLVARTPYNRVTMPADVQAEALPQMPDALPLPSTSKTKSDK